MKLWKNSCIILPCTNYGCEQGWFSWSLSKIDVRGLVLSNGQTFGAFTTSKQKSNEDCMSCMGESTSEHWVGYFNCRGFAECKITKIQLKVSLPRLLQNSTCKSFCRCRGGGGGLLPQNLGGVWIPLNKTCTIITIKICDFLYPISIPYFWPKQLRSQTLCGPTYLYSPYKGVLLGCCS